MSEWQPIETAPKDGDILVWGPHGHGHMVVFWGTSSGPEFPWGTLDGTAYPEVFTYWMPLPEPPK